MLQWLSRTFWSFWAAVFAHPWVSLIVVYALLVVADVAGWSRLSLGSMVAGGFGAILMYEIKSRRETRKHRITVSLPPEVPPLSVVVLRHPGGEGYIANVVMEGFPTDRAALYREARQALEVTEQDLHERPPSAEQN